MKTIEVKLTMEVPESATDEDIQSYLDVEVCGWNSMKRDNPCIGEAEVIDMDWTN